MPNNLEQQKSQQACKILQELDWDLWLIWVRETSQMADPVLNLVLGSDLVWQSALLFTKTGKRIAIVGNLDVGGIEALNIFDSIIPYTKSIREELLKELRIIQPQQIALNYSRDNVSADGLTAGMRSLLEEYLKGTPFVERFTSAEPLISRLRGRKVEEEISRIKKAIEITEQIFADARAFVQVGQSEHEIHQFFHQRMQHYDVTAAWLADRDPAVDAGPNKEFGHIGPTNNRTEAGHLLHFDFGVRYKGYCSDLQRMFFFGSKRDVPEEVQMAFEAVVGAIDAAAQFIKPGIAGYEADTIARDFIKKQGYEEYQHALGHQIGQYAHDGGTILGPLWDRYGDTPRGLVEKGNIFTLELYVTTKNYGQVSLEENILVTNKGCEFLSHQQKELVCIKD